MCRALIGRIQGSNVQSMYVRTLWAFLADFHGMPAQEDFSALQCILQLLPGELLAVYGVCKIPLNGQQSLTSYDCCNTIRLSVLLSSVRQATDAD